ncbi:hypothetical protein NDU88_002945 [Pleurodeles waltl]|uniref:Uncharacterized protein n=1 Tax=Pleurodeles waltl TaxID=8319 RepID=A0AAV7M3Y8_PLEWA|nr:hypothetical protein NDU88_002945 [Pleurodeles waltl]
MQRTRLRAACERNWQWRLTELASGGALSRAGGVYRRRGLSCGGAGARRAPALLKAARGILPELWCWGGPRAAWEVSLRGRAAERRLWVLLESADNANKTQAPRWQLYRGGGRHFGAKSAENRVRWRVDWREAEHRRESCGCLGRPVEEIGAFEKVEEFGLPGAISSVHRRSRGEAPEDL